MQLLLQATLLDLSVEIIMLEDYLDLMQHQAVAIQRSILVTQPLRYL